MQALWLAWKCGILLQQFYTLDILSSIQLCLKPPNASIPDLEEKKNFNLAITLTMVSFFLENQERKGLKK